MEIKSVINIKFGQMNCLYCIISLINRYIDERLYYWLNPLQGNFKM